MASDGEGNSQSLRRSTRAGRSNVPQDLSPETHVPLTGKRKAPLENARAENTAAPDKLEYLLTNPRSKLTKVDIADVINYNNFLDLSPESQSRLLEHLPPAAFYTYTPTVCTSHPDYQASTESSDRMDVDVDRSTATLDPSVFTSSFFLSAAHTWQDHLFSSWLGKKAGEDLASFTQGARAGSLHAEWKDEVWERDHQPDARPAGKRKNQGSLDLTALAKRGLLKEGDILSYKRTFPALNITVEKDILIDSTNCSHTVNFLLSPGTQRALHPSLLTSGSLGFDSGKVLAMQDVADAVALERGVLDVDGRVRPNDKFDTDTAECAASGSDPLDRNLGGAPSDALKTAIAVRAWKAFTVWRWREELRDEVELQLIQERGGRERVATLFYLRESCIS